MALRWCEYIKDYTDIWKENVKSVLEIPHAKLT